MTQNNHVEQKHLIILKKLSETASLKELAGFLHLDKGLPKDQVKYLMRGTIRVINSVNNLSEAELMKSQLESMGCHIEIETLVANLSVDIQEKHYASLKKELSKVLRSRISVTLYYVQLYPEDPDNMPPSITGMEAALENSFRESDTVYLLDDSSFILIGFSTDVAGADCLKNKVIRSLYDLFNETIQIKIGYSVFPDQIRTITELITSAKDNQVTINRGNATGANPDNTGQPTNLNAAINDKKSDDTIQLYFNKARGRLLKRFFELDRHELWAGLNKLPKANQEAFLYRLPFDFQMAPILDKIISSQTRSEPMNSSTESRLQEIIFSMDLENSLVERYRIMEEIIAKLDYADALPVLPQVAKRIIEIISDPDSTVENLTSVIETDSTLTIKILKIVNSAFYGYAQKISNVKEAIVILGNNEIRNIALGLAVSKTLSSSHLEGCCNPETLWQHSIGTAFIAQHFCKKLPNLKGASIFTAGLLHDFGKIFMMEHFPELYRRIHLDALKFDLPLYEVEEEHCNINHAKIGEIIAAKWNLPHELVLSIAKHHQFLKKDKYAEFSAIISLADYLYHETYTDEITTDVASSLSHKLTYGHFSILQQLFNGLNKSQLKDMVTEAKAVLDENHDVFSLL